MTGSTATNNALRIDGSPLSISDVWRVSNRPGDLPLETAANLPAKMQASVDLVEQAVAEGQTIYGVTTGFGGMAGVPVPRDQAAASQNNLLKFLAT